MTKREIEVVREIAATPEAIFQALTHPLELQYWFCHNAWSEPKEGGEFWVRWRNGWWARGVYERVEKPWRVEVTWQGKDEPGETRLIFEIEALDQGSRLRLVHEGFGSGPKWDKAVTEAERSWPPALENLDSVLTTGIDLREATRPMLGIVPRDVTPELVAKEDLSVESGIYLAAVVEGGAAEAAGLQAGDVIVSLGGMAVADLDDLLTTLSPYQAGDHVQVGYVRGRVRGTVWLSLRQRPRPEISFDPQVVVARVREQQASLQAEYRTLLEGVSEDKAARRPQPDEWSVKETLAHLVLSERFAQSYFLALIAGTTHAQWGDVNQVTEGFEMVFSFAPTVAALLDTWAQECENTLALFGALRPQVVAMKARYREMSEFLDLWDVHALDHLAQIKETLAAL